jgi:hypothetical protein
VRTCMLAELDQTGESQISLTDPDKLETQRRWRERSSGQAGTSTPARAALKRCRSSSAGDWSITVWRWGDGGLPECDVF